MKLKDLAETIGASLSGAGEEEITAAAPLGKQGRARSLLRPMGVILRN